MFEQIKRDILNQHEFYVDKQQELYPDATKGEIDDLASEELLNQADDLGLYNLVEYILWDTGYYCKVSKNNPYYLMRGEKRKTKSQSQKAFENMIGVKDLSQLFCVRKGV